MHPKLRNFKDILFAKITLLRERLLVLFNRFIHILPTNLELTDEEKKNVWETINEESQYTKIYWLQMFLASFIAALGLLQNSTAVVIGAMLVAPLLRPMQGLAYSIATAQSKKILHHSKVLLLSTLLAIATGFLVSVISPINIETAEVLARVSPNFLDLLIAAASAAIAFLALSFRSLSVSIAGVAMAASLVPPLAASGITLALGITNHAWGSFFLYFTNLVTILVIGVIIFFLFGYRPHQKEDAQNTAQRFGLLVLLIIGISIPLIITLLNLSREIRFTQMAQENFHLLVKEYISDAHITEFQVQKTKTGGIISATLALPESITFYSEDQEQISDKLADILNTDITMNFTLLRTASVESFNQNTLRSIEQQIKQSVRDYLVSTITPLSIINIEVNHLDTDNNGVILVRSVLALENGVSQFPAVENFIEEKFPDENISFVWIPIELAIEQQSLTQEDLHRAFVKSEILRIANGLFTEGEYFGNIQVGLSIPKKELPGDPIEDTIPFHIDQIDSYHISFDFYSTNPKSTTAEEVKNTLEENFQKNFITSVRIIPISVLNL